MAQFAYKVCSDLKPPFDEQFQLGIPEMSRLV